MTKSRTFRWSRAAIVLSASTLLICTHINCSRVNLSESSSTEARENTEAPLLGGGGIDGKLYRSYGKCPDGLVDVHSTILIARDMKSASLLSEDCKALDVARPISMGQIKFASENKDVFAYSGRVFDLGTGTADQKVTLALCSGSDALQVSIWRTLNNAEARFAEARSLTPGSGFPAAEIGRPVSDNFPVIYAARASAAFKLTVNAVGVADLSYVSASGSKVDVTALSCVSQYSPQPAFGPVTSLHYAPGSLNPDFSGAASAGFNLADVSSAAQLKTLQLGVKAMVWLGQCTGATASFKSAVQAFAGDSRVYGFYIADTPDPSGTWGPLCKPEDLMAQADYIHANAPNAVVFMTLANLGAVDSPDYRTGYNPANTHVDFFGLNPYPCTSDTTSCDFALIAKYVSAALVAGVPRNAIVPVYQAFGGGTAVTEKGGKYLMPSSNEARQILAAWASEVPHPAFDYTYSWGRQNGDTSLADSPDLRSVFFEHNR